jgi:hypothetical protein
MNQFILWHKRDIVLNASSPTLTDVHLERVVEDGEVFSLAHDHTPERPHSSLTLSDHVPRTPQPSPGRNEQGHDEMPHPSLAHNEQGHDEMPHHSPASTEQGHDEMPQTSQQAQSIYEQRVPSLEGHAQEDENVPEWEL